ncbi:hypothetical protein J4477_02530 [Candidatus Pacearchaeota archaeon]|nr:hypothetical protein [Candidatus Pacearchaeota archaeon]
MVRGKLIVFEGLDGIGKGEAISAASDYLKSLGKTDVFINDFHHYCEDFERSFKESTNLKDFPPGSLFLELSEPSYFGTGQDIRKEIIANNGRDYSSKVQVQAYSLDRLIRMRRCVIPFLNHGHDALQSRNFVSTLTYQTLVSSEQGKSVDEIRNFILEQEGTQIEMEYNPDLLVISTIGNVSELIDRLSKRKKKDDCQFENVEFQTKLKPFYDDPWIKEFFENLGTKVVYLDAGISVESTREQAVNFCRGLFEQNKLSQS